MKRLMIATVLLGSLAFTASAHADARALTSKGGECRIDTYASPSRFGVRVTDCSSRRGVRYVRSSGLQYQNQNPDDPPPMERRRSEVPHFNSQQTDSGVQKVRIDVEIVLLGAEREGARRTEKWRRPSRDCWVLGTRYPRDTLRCQIVQRVR